MFNFFRRRIKNEEHILPEQDIRTLKIEQGIKEGKILLFKKPSKPSISEKCDFDLCINWYYWAIKHPLQLEAEDGNLLEDVLEKYDEFSLRERVELNKMLRALPNSYHFLENELIKNKLKI